MPLLFYCHKNSDMCIVYTKGVDIMNFIKEIKQDATDAARRAGYKHPNKQGPDNLVKLGNQIGQRMEEMKRDSIATQEELLQFMTAVTRGQETEKVVAIP